MKEGIEAVTWGQEKDSRSANSFEECRTSCDSNSTNEEGCISFEYSSSLNDCTLFTNSDDIVFWPNPQMNYYEKTRCKHDLGKFKHYLHV